MNRVSTFHFVLVRGAALLILLFILPDLFCEVPAPAERAFHEYAEKVEARLAIQHRSQHGFIVVPGSGPEINARLRRGELVIENLTPPEKTDPPGAMLHDWRGTAFIPGGTAAAFEGLMKDLKDYPRRFSPDVVRAQFLSPYSGAIPDHFSAVMRIRQKHVITVVMDTTYAITYGRLDPQHGYSISRSTRIDEIASPGTANEHALSAADEHGFLWRLNTYWSYEEHDDGLYVQVESISLTRAIPTGLGWAVRPYVESVPRESLEFTLRSTIAALNANRQENGR